MPKIQLTDIVARAAKSIPGKQVSLWDAGTRGFGLRVNPQGTKTWQVMVGEKRKRITIGRYPDMSLKDARALALSVIANRGETDTRPTKAAIVTAADAVPKFMELHHAQSRPNWRKEQLRLLTKHLLAPFADMPLSKFTPTHILSITDALTEHPAERLHAHKTLKTFFKWAVQRDLIPSSPLANLPVPGATFDRDRLLSDAEVAKIYEAATRMAYPYGYLVLICIHTGLRRGEVAALKWDYITADTITIPSFIAKNGREHVIPNLIAAELALIPQTSEYLFPTSTGKPFCAWGKNKRRLDALCGVSDFVLHDFRRYLSSTMRRLSVPIDVTETILNHVTGSRSQIQRIYDRHDRLPEMREALALYERHLSATVSSN